MTGAPPVDAVVIGSGFGGSIAACRLAQAGHSVVVLERGRRYRPKDFPRDVTDVDALLWRRQRRKQSSGLYDLRFFSSLGCLVAAGVGGGSLVYANVHVRPDPVAFQDDRWPAGTDRASLDPYFDRVAAMLQPEPVPAGLQLPKRDAFHAAAAQLGRPSFDPDLAVQWRGGTGGCQLKGECELGCPVGAKRSADITYLAEAEHHGALVRPGRLVIGVRPRPGGYDVVHQDAETGTEEITTGRRVVLAAGTLGTNELLLRSRDQLGWLANISTSLGQGFSANGDFLGSIHKTDSDLSPDRGPDVTSVMQFLNEAPEFTIAAPTFNEAVMRVLASMGQPSGRLLRPLAPLLWRLLPTVLPWAFGRGLLSRPSPLPAPNRGDWRRCTTLIGIGRDTANGRIGLSRNGIDVTWDFRAENAALIDRITTAMTQIAACYDGTFSPLMTWNIFRRIITVHPLGGCRMSESPANGVVSPLGEVHSYPGLFIADGSVIPASIGFHPVMTISALAERTAQAVAAQYEPGTITPTKTH